MRQQAVKMLGVVITAAWMCVADEVKAGSLDSPSPPTNPSSAMYTLSDIYTKLDTGAPGSKRSGGFVGPTNAPGSTGHTLDELMDKTPSTNADAAGGEDVLNGKIYWGLKSGEWGTRTGAMATCVLSATTTVVAAGYYGPTNLSQVDTNLTAKNILAGMTIFGVAGVLNSNRAAVAKTGQTKVVKTGDDGTYRKGIIWPSPRFRLEAMDGPGTNCVYDNLTGLMWARHANIASNSVWSAEGQVTWDNAFNVITNGSTGLVNCVNYGGHADWRMPNIKELLSLIAWQYAGALQYVCLSLPVPNMLGTAQCVQGDPFFDIAETYWSSTADASSPSGKVWLVSISFLTHKSGKSGISYIWPVRGGR